MYKMKKSLLFLLVVSMIFAFAACSDKTEETTAVATEATTVAEETTVETTTVEETTAEETTVEASTAAEQDLRSTAEGFVGKSCTDLVNAIGEAESLHPGNVNEDTGMYQGYLHYKDFEVEFESETETYLENGDLSGCTVVAIVDSMFD